MGNTSTAGPTPWLAVGLIACVSLPALQAHAAGASKPAGCLIEPEQVADVGSPVTGIVEDLPVSLGDTVEAGQAVARLRADVERANANVALMRAQVDAEVKAAQASWELARQKVNRSKQLVDQNFVSAQALEQAEAEAEVAAQKYKLAQSQQKIYAREEAVAQAQLGLRTLRSPIKGVIVERYNNLGERVEDKPVLRVASIDPLRVSLMVPVAQYGQLTVGNTLVIKPELPGVEALRATVTYVDKVLDAASNSFRVRLSLPNPGNRLPGGLRCKADWATQAQAPAQTPASVKPASMSSNDVRPAMRPVSQPVMQSLTQPVTQPVMRPVMQPVMQPITRPITRPMTRPAVATMQPIPATQAMLTLKTTWTFSGPSLARIATRMAAERTAERTAERKANVAAQAIAAANALAAQRAASARKQALFEGPANRLSTTLTLASAY